MLSTRIWKCQFMTFHIGILLENTWIHVPQLWSHLAQKQTVSFLLRWELCYAPTTSICFLADNRSHKHTECSEEEELSGSFFCSEKKVCTYNLSVGKRNCLGKYFKYSCWSWGHSSVVKLFIYYSWGTENHHHQKLVGSYSWNGTASSNACFLNLVCK